MKHGFSLLNVFLLIMFIVLSTIIWLRRTDGSGAIQTTNLRWVNFIILLVFFMVLVVIELIVYIISLKTRK
ncbi:DUF3923 family protein [Lactiplantibacillus plantarum]|uniref:DUF3923 family protein n=1 Tax=Lactiplantibacillus plantarum TaxID=1590 RepID=UPI003C15FFBD